MEDRNLTLGSIAGSKVIDVNKHGGIILHELEGDTPKEGDTVSCVVDAVQDVQT